MDSSTADPQPQQPSQQLQQQQQQQPQHQQQPKPQHHQHQHQHPSAQQQQPTNPQAAAGPAVVAPFPMTHGSPYPPQYGAPFPNRYQHNMYPGYAPQYAYSNPAAWHQPPNFPAQAQQMPNVVPPQPQTNVPQQHTKSSAQIMNSVTTDRPTNPGLPNSNLPKPSRQRNPAVLKDPRTNKEVPLELLSTSTSKPSNVGDSPAQTLLQKVSEDGLDNQKKSPSDRQNPTTAATEAVTNKKAVETKKDVIETTKKVTASQQDSSPPTVKCIDKFGDSQGNSTLPAPTEATATRTTITTSTTTTSSSSSLEQAVPDTTTLTTATVTNTQQQQAISANETEPEAQNLTPNTSDQSVTDKKVVQVNGDTKDDDSNNDQEKSSDESKSEELTYEPGQYNPLTNRDGKKKYSKQFLIDVCEKVCKIKLADKNGDADSDSNRAAYAAPEPRDLFQPDFCSNQRLPPRQNDPSRRQNQHNYSGRSSAGQEKARKVISSASLTQEVELKTVSNPWRPGKDAKESVADSEAIDTEAIKKKFRSILNKLTPNNFESLAASVTELNIDTESKLGDVIDIVFAKALAEPGYCVLYGQMCSHLKKVSAGQANFGNTLLKRCQAQFQSDIYAGLGVDERKEKIEKEENPEVKKQLSEELYEDMYRCRMRGLGLIKFIGELYKIEMLNSQIMFDCVLRLLSDPGEESLECLCDLLATIGEKLDKSCQQRNVENSKKASKNAPKANAYQGGNKSAASVVANSLKKPVETPDNITTLDQVFDRLAKIRNNNDSLSMRIKFKILDILDLREKDRWQSKRTKDNNPKKIEEIRAAHNEKLEQERRQQNVMGPRRSQEGRRGLGHSGGSSGQLSSLGNDHGNRGNSNMHSSSSSQMIRDHNQYGDNVPHDAVDHRSKLDNIRGLFGKSTANEDSSKNKLGSLRPAITFRPGLPSTTSAASGNSAAKVTNISSIAAKKAS